MEIRNVALLGAGAIGCWFIAGLAEVPDLQLCLIADGARKQRLEQNGVEINGRHYSLPVRSAEAAAGADLLIVALKYGALRPCLPAIEAAAGPHTTVLCAMNGVDSEEIVGERIGPERVLPCLLKVSSERKGSSVKFNPEVGQGLLFGETDGSVTERVLALQVLMERAGMHYMVRDNILQDIWFKYALNISRNLPQAILNCPFRAYGASAHVAYISEKLREEVIAVADARGIDLHAQDSPAGTNSPVSPEARFSTLQDLDAGRETEIEMFSGTLIRMGRAAGVPTPWNEFAYHAIKALEEKNAGLF